MWVFTVLQGKSQSGIESSNGSLLVCSDLCGTGHYAIKNSWNVSGVFQLDRKKTNFVLHKISGQVYFVMGDC